MENERKGIILNGHEYATVKNFKQDLQIGRSTAYRILNEDFKAPSAKWHKYYTRLRIPGQRAPIWGIPWEEYSKYLVERKFWEQLEQMDQEDIEDFANNVSKITGPLSIPKLLSELYYSTMSAGETEYKLKEEIENIAVEKNVNPFTDNVSFVKGKTYNEYVTWIERHQLEERPQKLKGRIENDSKL